MKWSFRILVLSLSTALSTIAFIAPDFSRADEENDDFDICLLPVCELQTAWDEFRAMKETGRVLTLNGFTSDYQANADVENAENLIVFADGILRIVADEEKQAPDSEATLAANRLLEQSLTQAALLRSMKDSTVVTHFTRLAVGANRYLVLDTWAGRVPNFTDRAELQNLIQFFEAAQPIVVAAKDEEYVLSRAKTGWAQANVRMSELTPAIAWAVPIQDSDKALVDFKAMSLPERLVLVQEFETNYPAATAPGPAQASLGRFLSSAIPVMALAGETQDLIRLRMLALLTQYLERLTVAADLPVSEMIWAYTMQAGPTPKYTMIQGWSAAIAATTDFSFLDKLAHFFAATRQINLDNKEEEYMVAFADRAEQDTYVRMIEIGVAPELTLPIATAEDLDLRVAEFGKLNPALQFLLLENLGKKHTEAELGQGSTQVLLSLMEYVKRILPMAEALPPSQAYVREEAQYVLDAAIELAASAGDTSADVLISLTKQLPSAGARSNILYFWGAKIDGLKERPAAIRLYKYFVVARKVSLEKGDSETVVRDAQGFEQKTKAKIAELSN